CQKQLKVLESQIRLTHEDRQQLDEQIPRGGGPLVSRLQSAEKELSAIEELLPMDAGRQEVQGKLRAAVHRAKEAQSDLKQTRQRWSQALSAVGLPETLSPKQVGQLSRDADQIADLQRRRDRRHEELNQRRREYATFTERISQLLGDAGLAKQSDSAVAQLRQLATELADQQASIDRRQEIRNQAKKIRRQEAKYRRAMENFQRRKRRLILDAGADDEPQFRSLAMQQARAQSLRKEREQLQSDMVSIIQGQCSEKAIEKILSGSQADRLEQRWEELGLRLQAMTEQLKKCFEQRGQLNQQIKALTEDRTLDEKQLELGCVEHRLADACERWRTLAATELLLEEIRKLYEENRQPETLQEASGYLNRLTDGRYKRVWTPLGESVLRVDDAQGNSLSVEVLSRGTREQLFMSLRLALVSLYARRGTQLPLILDDVLVNFDAARAKAAVAVLRDFAKAGHQLLVFTCHEHIRKLFKSAKVAVQELPKNDEPEVATIAIEQPKKRRSKKRKKPATQESPKEVSEEELEEEELVASEDEQDSPEEMTKEDATEAEDIEDSEDDAYEVDSDQDEEDYDDEEEEDYEEDEYEEEDDPEQSEAA
ncbi:MAG: hypothetical protein IH991_16430, partial [Planctomycetes bacterium]|nr:hypothetical protein [Planctomycetota bacterium]